VDARGWEAASDHSCEEVRTVEELALARVLEECLDAMEDGETDLEKLVALHPDAAIEMRPLLEIALRLRAHMAVREAPMSLDFHDALRERLLAEIRA
jgi:hypothetical protein